MKKSRLFIPFIPVLLSCDAGKDPNIAADWTENANIEVSASSTDADRIQRIKTWYEQAVKAEKNPVNQFNGSAVETDRGENFVQKVNRALLESGFEILTAEFSGWEWDETVKFYFKDDELFFVYISGAEVSSRYQYRIYYSSDGNVIRLLHKEGADGEMSENKEVTGKQRAEVINMVDQDLAKARKILRTH
ncbi:MAG: hypothetical protein ACKOKF_07735 [Bacteroidota bacterium]